MWVTLDGEVGYLPGPCRDTARTVVRDLYERVVGAPARVPTRHAMSQEDPTILRADCSAYARGRPCQVRSWHVTGTRLPALCNEMPRLGRRGSRDKRRQPSARFRRSRPAAHCG